MSKFKKRILRYMVKFSPTGEKNLSLSNKSKLYETKSYRKYGLLQYAHVAIVKFCSLVKIKRISELVGLQRTHGTTR